jgi:small subunit ribosomal protein S16
VAVRIRLTRVGATKQPTYRFVVSDSRNARDGRSIDTLGHYNPRTDPIEINVDEDKARDWMSRGAKPSDTVARLFRRVGVLPEETAPVRSTKAAPKAKAQAKAQAAEAAAAAPPPPPPAAAEEAPATAEEAPATDEASETEAASPDTEPAEPATADAADTADTAETETAEATSAEEE